MNNHTLLKECAVAIAVLMGEDCGCEAGTAYTPEFICGSHRLLNKISDELGEECGGCEHDWITRPVGGDPNEASSRESATYCNNCGIEAG